MHIIEISSQIQSAIPRKFVINFLSRAADYLEIKNLDLSVVFVNQLTIKKLNSQYRNQPLATDVLSFNYTKDKKSFSGEIVICYTILKHNSSKLNHSIKQELSRILIHSLLHLVGYRHANQRQAVQMQRMENKILKSLEIK